jgi:hypothetical protein
MSETLHALNQIPAGEICHLAMTPAAYRETFQPRQNFGQPSPLEQPRIVLEDDLQYEDGSAGFGLVRILLIGMAAELLFGLFAVTYVIAGHKY